MPAKIGLRGRKWTVEEFLDRLEDVPHKFELMRGELWTRKARRAMLRALMEHMGLIEVVRQAPPDLWHEALRRVEAESKPGKP